MTAEKQNSSAVFSSCYFEIILPLHILIPSSLLSSHLHRNKHIVLLSKKCYRSQKFEIRSLQFEIPQTGELPSKWDRIAGVGAVSKKFYYMFSNAAYM